MSKHSDGPWIFSESSSHVTVRTENGECVFHDDKRIDGVIGDANLIAAAPELLEALEKLHSKILGATGMYGDYYMSPEFNSAATAIKKAKGETA